MARKILIDSDICLDAITERIPFHNQAQLILHLAEKREIEAYVTSVAFSNMFYLLSKWSSSQKAYTVLSKLRKIVSIGSVTQQEVDATLQAKWTDFEDALQYYAAKTHNCELIVTRNISDYKQSELPVFTPSEFLDSNG
jgi:predicted nucleic acid-binding protein